MQPVVMLFDVDNTLLDNDAVEADLSAYLSQQFGNETRDRYWALFEQLRSELGYADYLGALQRYRMEHLHDPRVVSMSQFLIDYRFEERVYPRVFELLQQASELGPVVILSDGDVVFQPRKVRRSGLWDAVQGRVLIYVHKEQMLADVEQLFPAERYVLVDDKVRILNAVKDVWHDRVLTVFPRQGHYAAPKEVSKYPPPDVTVERVGDLLEGELAVLRAPRH
jgi:FMN phosphatase YigB (HAD superfamily)